MERRHSGNKNDRNASNSFISKRSGVVPERKLIKQSGSLEFIEENVTPNSQRSSRPASQMSDFSDRPCSRSSLGSVPPGCDSAQGKRTLTPTKQVSLQAVRRKEERNTDLFVDHVDWRDLESSRNEANDTEDLSETFRKMRLAHQQQREVSNLSEEGAVGGAFKLSAKEMKKEEKEEDEKEKESSGDDDSDDDDEVVEPRKAPTELLMEFVDCLMKKDFQNADKLCKMILLYEPDNPEALSFKPLIEEKIQLDEAAALEDSDDDDSDDSDEDSDDDDSDDSDESTDDSEEEEEDDDNKKKEIPTEAEGASMTGASKLGSTHSAHPPSDQRWSATLRDFSKPSTSKQ